MKAQSRKALRKTIAVLALGLAGCFGTGLAAAAAPGNLDELLEQTRLARETESKANAAREAKFLAERNRQSAMMAEVKAEVDEARKRSQQLSSTFDANEKRLTDMQAHLERFWFELQREMTETGKVVKYKAKVVSPEGAPVDATVTRVGPFAATAD